MPSHPTQYVYVTSCLLLRTNVICSLNICFSPSLPYPCTHTRFSNIQYPNSVSPPLTLTHPLSISPTLSQLYPQLLSTRPLSTSPTPSRPYPPPHQQSPNCLSTRDFQTQLNECHVVHKDNSNPANRAVSRSQIDQN
jgi:hypothetical protein